jgi:hypothetical protein
MNGWIFFETIGPSLFSLGPLPKDGPENIEQSPKWHYPKHAMWNSNMTFHPKPFGWAWAQKTPM